MNREAPSVTFGRYQVCRRLGRGGMGTVYLAEDTTLRRPVAVKVPHPEQTGNERMRERFLREAQIAASIEHANVCPVLDFGEQDGTFFLVMRYLEGTPLNQATGSGRAWEPARIVPLMYKLAQGVRAIHAKGLIHRDLKPANVLIRPDGEPIILDLGLARSFTDIERLGDAGEAEGTPAYMAPEQLQSDPARLGPHTDIYSLGVLLFELLTGQRPFTLPIPAVYAQILQEVPPRPSSLVAIDPEAEAICLKAMAKGPAQRYANAHELAEALRAWHRVLARRRVLDPSLSLDLGSAPREGSRDDAETPRAMMRTLLLPGRERPLPERPRIRLPSLGLVLALLLLTGLLGAAVSWLLPVSDPVVPLGQADPPAAPPDEPGPPKEEGPVPPGPGVDPPDLPADPGPPARPAVGPDPPPEGPPEGQPAPPAAFLNSLKMKLVRVGPGTYLMGSPVGEARRETDEFLHEVTITRAFYIAVFEVTQAEYAAVMGKNPSHFHKGNGGGPGHPVEGVSWEEAAAFCQRLSARESEKAAGRRYRLPTEAEWEYACRGGPDATRTAFHFGDVLTGDRANFDSLYPYGSAERKRSRERTMRVGSYSHNTLGLFDLHGNVFEWCADWYAPYPERAATDPRGPAKGTHRVLRGGSWNYRGHDCRSANRDFYDPAGRGSSIGFRVVCEVAGE